MPPGCGDGSQSGYPAQVRTNAAGLCLSPTDPAAADPDPWTGATPPAVYKLTASKLVMAACDSSDLQKWTVIPVFQEAALKDVVER